MKNLKYHPIYTASYYSEYSPPRMLQTDIHASLILQKLLYFNFFYSIMQAYLLFCQYVYQFSLFSVGFEEALKFITFIFYELVEIARLYNGYYGNVKESFPELISFVLFSLLQAGLMIFFFIVSDMMPIESPLLIVEEVFVIVEIIICAFTMKKLVKISTAQFYLQAPELTHKNKKLKDDDEKTLLQAKQRKIKEEQDYKQQMETEEQLRQRPGI